MVLLSYVQQTQDNLDRHYFRWLIKKKKKKKNYVGQITVLCV